MPRYNKSFQIQIDNFQKKSLLDMIMILTAWKEFKLDLKTNFFSHKNVLIIKRVLN